MKILLVTEFFPTGKDLKFSGGVEARTFFVAKHLAKEHKVIVICSRQKGSKKFERMHRFLVYRVDPIVRYTSGAPTITDALNRLRSIQSAISLGKQFEIDVVDGGNFLDHFVAKQISQSVKRPVVFWYPDVFFGQWIKTSGILGGISGWLLERFNLSRSADRFVAISKVTSNKLIDAGVPKTKLSIISCGIDPTEFSSSNKKTKIPTIICISRLVNYKNLKTLILAFAHLTTQIREARLIIVGSGPEERNLKSLSKALNVKNKIKFLSNLQRKKLIELLKTSHIFSLPSRVEGFGISTIEAAAAGLPYVNSNIDVQREVTKNGQGGFLIDPDNPLMFSKRFYQLISDKKLYRKKSLDARQLAKNYDWERVATETEKVYRGLL